MRKYVIIVLLGTLLIAMGVYTYQVWTVASISASRDKEFGDSTWILAGNIHFMNILRNHVDIYSQNLEFQSLTYGNMHLNVIPLILEPARHPKSGEHFINVNDTLLLSYACYLAVTDNNPHLAGAILQLLIDNDSYASEKDSYIIYACAFYLNGDTTYEEVVAVAANEYVYNKKLYSTHLPPKIPAANLEQLHSEF